MLNNNNKGNYDTDLLKAIKSLDKSNSTHLQTSENGYEEMANRIIEKYDDVNKLKNGFELKIKDENNPFNILIEPTKSVKGNGIENYNLSFASKFCADIAEQFETKNQYSKYDTIVKKALPIYIKKYLGKDIEYNIFHFTNKKYNQSNKFKNR